MSVEVKSWDQLGKILDRQDSRLPPASFYRLQFWVVTHAAMYAIYG